MKYDEAVRQARIVLDDEFNDDFTVFDEAIAGEDSIVMTLQNWFRSSGVTKEAFADDLEFRLRKIRSARTDRRALEAATILVIESGAGKQDTDTGEWQ